MPLVPSFQLSAGSQAMSPSSNFPQILSSVHQAPDPALSMTGVSKMLLLPHLLINWLKFLFGAS